MGRGKPALVLLHGITSSGRAWEPLVGELSTCFEVRTPTALGHRGRPVPSARISLTDFVDDAQRYLDAAGLDRPLLAGHSLGGYTAIELARRGRAAAVVAFSPAGFWAAGDSTGVRVAGMRRSLRTARVGAPVLKAVVSTAAGRAFWMGAAVHTPRSMAACQARQVIEDQAGCAVATRLVVGEDEFVHPMDPLPCPITVAWAEHDDVLPMPTHEAVVRTRLPEATFVVLPGVGHAAMVDDPALVIRTILAGTG